MNHFVSQYHRLLYERDREEDIAEHKTKQVCVVLKYISVITNVCTNLQYQCIMSFVSCLLSVRLKMVHSRLWPIERHALSIYTKATFELFRTEVDKASNYRIGHKEGNTYTISHDNAANRAHWARVHFKVQVIDEGLKYVCECGLYEHFGMLCCHSIRVSPADVPILTCELLLT